MTNARFVEWVNGGPVTLTLAAGQPREWCKVWSHDEGWSREHIVWEFDGQVVTRTIETDGRDCDGRLSTSTLTSCPVNQLRARRVNIDAETWLAPEWERCRGCQRDYRAEAAGY